MKIVAISVFAFLIGCIPQKLKAQAPLHKIAYAVDPTIQPIIAQKKLDGMFTASLDIEWRENGKDAGLPLSGKAYPTMTSYFVQSDTIAINLIPGLSLGAIVSIELVKDSAIVSHIISPRDAAPQFKLLPTDAFMRSISVPAKTAKLVLVAPPIPGKPIEGYVEFETVVFYQQDGAGLVERTYKAMGYFKAAKM